MREGCLQREAAKPYTVLKTGERESTETRKENLGMRYVMPLVLEGVRSVSSEPKRERGKKPVTESVERLSI